MWQILAQSIQVPNAPILITARVRVPSFFAGERATFQTRSGFVSSGVRAGNGLSALKTTTGRRLGLPCRSTLLSRQAIAWQRSGGLPKTRKTSAVALALLTRIDTLSRVRAPRPSSREVSLIGNPCLNGRYNIRITFRTSYRILGTIHILPEPPRDCSVTGNP